jgi:hypothetical protein
MAIKRRWLSSHPHWKSVEAIVAALLSPRARTRTPPPPTTCHHHHDSTTYKLTKTSAPTRVAPDITELAASYAVDAAECRVEYDCAAVACTLHACC